MRSKEKTNTRDEILRNFTREFLIEEKRRCEIDRYVADFRILIHKRPHENHNYLNRLLQDYTNMFLSHERISSNKMNQADLRYHHKTQLASRKIHSPKQRYVKSKLSVTEHQSYLVLRAKTEEFLKKLREYEKLEQIAYEIFLMNSSSENKIYRNEIEQIIEPSSVLKLKSANLPFEETPKRHHKNIYVVNSSETKVDKKKSNFSENYEQMNRETELFLENNRKHNDVEQKLLSEQYKKNPYIKKYVDQLTSSQKLPKRPQTPKRGIYSKLKNIIGLNPDNSTKFYKNIENDSTVMADTNKLFLKNERKYNNFEFEAYKLFYIKNGEFQNPLIENIKKIAYEVPSQSSESNKKVKDKVDSKIRLLNQRNEEINEFKNFNLVKCSPSESEKNSQFDKPIAITQSENYSIPSKEQYELLQKNKAFLENFKMYEEKQRLYFVIHMRKHYVHPIKERKENFLVKIKHLFFGKGEKSKERIKHLHEITQEFLKNEQYHHGLQNQANYIFTHNGCIKDSLEMKNINEKQKSFERIEERKSPPRKYSSDNPSEMETPKRQTISLAKASTSRKDKNKIEKSGTLKKQDKIKTSSPKSFHRRSKSEDLLFLKKRTTSLESRKSPTGHKTFSDRLKSMVGIGNRQKSKSRDNVTDPVYDFLEHERFHYDGTPASYEKYSRSFSTPKDGTLKTKTKRFLSTENFLYQDIKDKSAGKPPSGRRRNEKRSRDNKEKRSRTLSPAQKLVSKFRNLVQKNNSSKEKDYNTNTLEITQNFISDHRRFNDALGNLDFEKPKDKNENKTSIMHEHSSEKLNKQQNNQLLNEHTRIFLHDMKKYHDIERGPDETKKTLIFVNNKKGNSKLHQKPEVNIESSKEKLKEKLNEKQISSSSVENTSEKYEKELKWIENSSKTKTRKEIYSTQTVTRKIIQNTVVQNTKITSNNGYSKDTKTVMENSSNNEHVYENVPFNMKNITISQTFKNKAGDDVKENISKITNESHEVNDDHRGFNHKENLEKTKDRKESNINLEKEKIQLLEETESKWNVRKEETAKQKAENKPRIDETKIIPMEPRVEQVQEQYSEAFKGENKHPVKEAVSSREKSGKLPGEGTKLQKQTLPQLKKLVVGSSKKPGTDENDILVRQQTGDFLDEMRKHHDVYRKAITPTKMLWLSDQKPRKQDAHSEKSDVVQKMPISDEEKNNLLMIRLNTDEFLKDHKEYHNRQRTDDNDFYRKNTIWLSTKPPKKKGTLITKVKNWMSPHQEKKSIQEDTQKINKALRDQTAEFLRKHQYLIHKEEAFFVKPEAEKIVKIEKVAAKKAVDPNIDEKRIITEKHSVESAEKQQSSQKHIEKSPEKETKSKKSSLSKLKKLVVGSSKKPGPDENDLLIRQQTGDFLDEMRKHHDIYKEAITPTKILWLSEHKPKKQDAHSEKSDVVQKILISDEEKNYILMIRRNTDMFLKDHQDYHNRQRTDDNDFYRKNTIWLSSKPSKKKDTLITKVKNWMSPHQEKKSIQVDTGKMNKALRDQTAEFLTKHQYLIHKEETLFLKPDSSNIVKKANVAVKKEIDEKIIKPEKHSVDSAEKQQSSQKHIEKSPDKEMKSNKSSLSKLKKLVIGSSKKPGPDENDLLVRQQTSEFLDEMRKHHDVYRQAITPTKILWLSEQKPKKQDGHSENSEVVQKILISDEEKNNLLMIRNNTDEFLNDHQDYHNRQRTDDNEFYRKNTIWLSNKPSKKKDTLITKVKNWMSPHQEKKSIQENPEKTNKALRDQTAEFLRKHQYLIHKEETLFLKPDSSNIVKKVNVAVKNEIDEKIIKPERHLVNSVEKQQSSQKYIEKSPEKETKSKQSSQSKLKKIVIGSSKKTGTDGNELLVRQHTGDFLDEMRKHHDVYRQAITPTKILWLSEQKPKKQDAHSEKSEVVQKILISDEEKNNLLMIRLITDEFLKDHQDYHNRQRTDDNDFLRKNTIWLSTKPSKKKDTLITKVKNWMSPHQEKKSIQENPEKMNKALRDQTAEFLRKHQYLIHKEETIFVKKEVDQKIVEKIIKPERHLVNSVEKQQSSQKYIEKSPEKETKSKQSSLPKLKKFVTGSFKKPGTDGNDLLVRQQTGDFLDEMRKHHDVYREATTPTKIFWLSEQKPKKLDAHSEKSDVVQKILISDEEKNYLLMIRRNTDMFLKDHQDYHNRQRTDDNDFYRKNTIWLSSKPSKKKDTLITKVKNWMSPHQEKSSQEDTEKINKALRDETAEFLKKHQYLIHKQETLFVKLETEKIFKLENTAAKKEIDPKIDEKIIKPEKYSVDSAEKQQSSRKHIEKSPEKEIKSKKSSLSKLKKLVIGSSKKPGTDENDLLVRQKTGEFLDEMRKHHDAYSQTITPTKILWLSEQKPKKQDAHSEKSDVVQNILISGEEKNNLLMIRRNTDKFLKDHQDYHNRQRTDDNDFHRKNTIWLSNKPSKKKDTLITKVKNWMSPHQEKKSMEEDPEKINKELRDKTAEFLRKHQYLIHREETIFVKKEIEEKIIKPEKQSVDSAEKQQSSQKYIEKSPEKEIKSKKSSLSKLKKLVTGSSKKPGTDEKDLLVRKQTGDFLDEMRKHHDVYRQAIAPTKILWLSEQKPKKQDAHSEKSEVVQKILISDEEKNNLLMIRQNTDEFLKNHQDYHNRQRTDDNDFYLKMESPENTIWLSTKPSEKKDTLITKVKNWMSPHQEKKSSQEDTEKINKALRDQTAEFLRKHQYLIHKEETIFVKKEIDPKIEEEIIKPEKHSVESAEKQQSSQKYIEKSPEKEMKPKKSSLSKLKKLVTGSSKKTVTDENDLLVRQQTGDFLDEMRKHHDVYREATTPTKIFWLSEQNPKKLDAHSEKSDVVQNILIDDEEKNNQLMIRRNTDKFLKDHQDYHNRQRTDDHDFHRKNTIWLSNKPSKKKDTLITKFKNWMSPHQENKSMEEDPEKINKVLRDQTAEFLRKHQYLIHKEETLFLKPEAEKIVKLENIAAKKGIDPKIEEKIIKPEKHSVESAEKQQSSQKHIEKSPEKETKSKKSSLSKLKKLVVGSSKKPGTHENDLLVRQQTGDFLDEMRKHHDVYREAITPTKILWLSEQKPKKQDAHSEKSDVVRNIPISDEEKNNQLMVRSNTDKFLKDHQDYHKRQYSERDYFWNSANSFPLVEQYRNDSLSGENSKAENIHKKKVKFLPSLHNESHSYIENKARDNNHIPANQRDPLSSISTESDKPKVTPRKHILKNIQPEFVDASKIFRENEQQFIIEKTKDFLRDHIKYQNNQWSNRENAIEKSIKQSSLDKLENPSRPIEGTHNTEVFSKNYLETRRALIIFLEDHLLHHEKERTDFITFISKRNKPNTNDASKKETKSKSKFMAKLKSLVGQSQENIPSDKKTEIENLKVRKQTLEFLISQKCYNDLENNACYKFAALQMQKKKEPEYYQQNLGIGSITKEDSTFSNLRELSIDGSPNSGSQKPLSSSPVEKISEMENITEEKKPDFKMNPTTEKMSNDLSKVKDHNEIFLSNEINYINSENDKWKQYLKYKPEAGFKKQVSLDEKPVKKSQRVQNVGPNSKNSARKSSSQIESEKIDHEVNLHRTKVFLDDQKCFNDSLLNDSSKYVSTKNDWNFEADNIQGREDSPSKMEARSFSSKKVDVKLENTHHIDDPVKQTTIDSSSKEIQKNKSRKGVISRIKDLVIRDSKSHSISAGTVPTDELNKEVVQGKDYIRGTEDSPSFITLTEVSNEEKETVKPSFIPEKTTKIAENSNKKVYFEQLTSSPTNERKKFARDKILTQEFLLNQKEYSNLIENRPKGVGTKNSYSSDSEYTPSAPVFEELRNTEAESKHVIHREVKPLSPRKTVFTEIRQREESPDKTVYLMKEGYMITKETDVNEKTKNDEREHLISEKYPVGHGTMERPTSTNPRISSETNEHTTGMPSVHIDGAATSKSRTPLEGQDRMERSKDSFRSVLPQGDSEVRRTHSKNCYFIFFVILVVLIAMFLLRDDDDEKYEKDF